MPRNRRKNVRNNRNSRNDWRNITSEDSEVDLDDSDDSDDFNNCSDTFSLLEKKRNLRKRPTSKNFYDRNNVNEAGCSIVDNNSNNSKRKLRSGTVKRKCKERTKIKRLRMYDADSDSSDSSDIQPVRNRRHRLINMDSSGSSSDQIIRPSVPRLLCPMWSDDTDSSEDQHDGRSTHLSSDFSSEIRYRTRLHDNIGMNNFVRISINNPTSTSSSSSLCNFSSSSSSSSFTSNNTFNFSSVSSDISNESSVYNSTNSNRITEQMPSSDSDSSEADGEKCAICLKKFKKQRIGNPSKCDHSFCLHCLQEWSKTSTTCPVDRLVFDAIVVRNEVNGNILERIEVQTCNFGTFPTTDVEEVFINDSIICEVCGSGDDGETLLLCDLCNLGYHMACLHPPLSTIPEGSWYCPPCRELRNNSSIHLNESMGRILNVFPVSTSFNVSSSSRRYRRQSRSEIFRRTNLFGPPPHGRGPFTRRLRNHITTNLSVDRLLAVMNQNVLNRNTISVEPRRQKSTKIKKKLKKRPQMPRNVAATTNVPRRLSVRTDDTLKRISNIQSFSVVDLVFPNFNLFEEDNLDYFSDENESHSLEGEVAIMAQVHRDYSARRIRSRKNVSESITNNSQSRTESTIVSNIEARQNTSNLLESILESQTLWHSKNTEISSKKDGKLEIKLKQEIQKPDLSNANHSFKEIPLFPNKNESSSASDTNKSYTNNTRYSNLSSTSGATGSNSFSISTTSFNSLNPSTRPGFSNILGNNSSALDLSPFRGAAPIRFRMNPPRPALRRPNFNSNSVRHGTSTNSTLNSVQSPRKSVNISSTTGGDDDVDLYDDIESENVESEKIPEMFSSLEPPPEPPALLIGSDSSSDEDDGLIIDDKATNNSNKNNIYDPTEPNEDSDIETSQDRNTSIVPGYLRSPSYGGLSEFGPHLPLPEPPALPIELDSVNNSDEDEDEVEAECPNMTLYSTTSINLANNVQDIPIPESAYPSLSQEELEYIPIPTTLPNVNIPLPQENNSKFKVSSCELYSPTKKDSTDSSDSEDENVKYLAATKSNEIIRSPSSSIDNYSSGSSEDQSSSYDEETELSCKIKEKNSKKETLISDRISNEKKRIKNDLLIEVDNQESDESVEDVNLIQHSMSPIIQSDVEIVNRVSTEDPTEKVDEQKVVVETEIEKYEKENSSVSDEDGNEINEDENTIDSSSAGNEPNKQDEEKYDVDDISLKNDLENSTTEAETDALKLNKKEENKKRSLDVAMEAEDSGMRKDSSEMNISNAYLLPSDDLDPVSDVEYNDFQEYHKLSSSKDRKKKRKKTRKHNASVEVAVTGAATVSTASKTDNRELEEGEIEDDKTKRKRSIPHKRKKSHSGSEERVLDKKLKRKKDKKDLRNTGKENKESTSKNDNNFTWKKLSRSTKERNYRDGKGKGIEKSSVPNKNRIRDSLKSKKEKRKEMERYDVRKIVSDKPRTVRDEFGRDISVLHSRSRSRSQSRSRSISPTFSYSSRRRSKGPLRRSFSQDDRWIDWSPVWTQRRSRSRTRRSTSRSRNRSRLSGDRYRNRSKNRDREYDKRDVQKRRRSLSSTLDKYSSPVERNSKKRRRSRERTRKSGSYTTERAACREVPEYFYERSWSRSISYASLTPDPDPYVNRYERSPSVIDAGRIAVVSPNADRDVLAPNSQNLTVIVPNIDANKKKHKKKKDSKKKKKKQPSKEVFTSGDNIVVSVNFDDNQKIISAKSSKRKHEEEKIRKKKKDESTRKKRKQTLQVSDEVLNAKPVAVIDLNSSPCKEMSPTEVISLTDSGDDDPNPNEGTIPSVRRTPQEYSEGTYQTNENTTKSPSEHRAYVMTSSGPKTPPEPPIKFTVGSTAPMRTLPTNPIFEQDEEIENGEETIHYNKGPNTPPEPLNETRRSITPNTTMYDPFEPTKSRSQSPENAEMYEERKDATPEERRPIIDMFSEESEKLNDNQNTEKSKNEMDSKEMKNSPVEIIDEQSTAVNKTSPTKEILPISDSSIETTQTNGVNTLVLDLSSLGDDFVPKSSIPLVKTSQGKYEFQSGKTPDKPITVVIAQQNTPVKPQPQQVMVIPTRQVPTKSVEPIKQPIFPDILPWKLPTPISQPSSFSTPPPTVSTITPTHSSNTSVTPLKVTSSILTHNGGQDEATFELDDSPYSPASSEGDDLFEPPPLGSGTAASPKMRPAPIPAVNSYKARVDALFTSSPIKKLPPRSVAHPSKPISAIKASKKITKTHVSKKDEDQLKILDDVPNSAVEMIVKEKFLKKLHRQERVVEEVKVVLKPHYAKKHITKEEYKDILRRAVPKICHNKSGDINPSKIQSLIEAYVKKIRHSKKKGGSLPGSSTAPMFPSMTTGKTLKKQKSLWS